MRVVFSAAADREADRLSSEVAERVFAAIRALRENPRRPGCRLLRDRASRTWRVRVGDWRILYDIDDAGGVVRILHVLHRSQAY